MCRTTLRRSNDLPVDTIAFIDRDLRTVSDNWNTSVSGRGCLTRLPALNPVSGKNLAAFHPSIAYDWPRQGVSMLNTPPEDVPEGMELLEDGSVRFLEEPAPGDFDWCDDDEDEGDGIENGDTPDCADNGNSCDDADYYNPGEYLTDDDFLPAPIDLDGRDYQHFKFVRIEPCTFIMGSPPDERGRHTDEILHPVTLTRPFYIMTTPITNNTWAMAWGQLPHMSYPDPRHMPATNVTWWDVQAYIRQMNRIFHPIKFRLPTEAEWECACRAGTTGPTYGGFYKIACNRENSYRRPQPVAMLEPNAWGLYDMLGNVHEWCQDFYGPYHDGPAVDPTGPTLSQTRDCWRHMTDDDGTPWTPRVFPRVARGGSAQGDRISCRAASRESFRADITRTNQIGFRLVVDEITVADEPGHLD